MKRTKKIAMFAILFFGLVFSPLFFACANLEIVLNKPTSFDYQINEDTGRELIVVEANKFASSYLFGIGTSYDGENVNNFLTYEVPAKTTVVHDGEEIQISQNYLDVTNIFKNNKTYYFYVQYKGNGIYKDSEISKVKSVTITSKLDTPRLSYASGKLSWSNVNNAVSYTVYATTDSWREVVNDNVKALEFDVSNYVSQKVANGLDSEIQFFVYANTNQNYIRSSDSNKVTYSAHLLLQTPANFAVKKTAEALTWSPVPNAESYTIKVNNLEEIVVTSSDFVISAGKIVFDSRNIYQRYGFGEYEFCIKANAHGNFIESSYSNAITDTFTQKLSTPQNVRCVEGFNNVEIMWDPVGNANVYILEFSDTSNGYTLKQFRPNDSNNIPQDITLNSITLSYSELGITNIQTLKNDNFVIRVKAKGYNYYIDSDYSNGKSVISKSQILTTPTLSNDSANNMLSWTNVYGAVEYVLSIEFGGERQVFTTTNTYYDYAEVLTSAGEYKVVCYAVASNEIYNSVYSNEITITINSTLETPVIQNVKLDGEYFEINFTADTKSNTQTLFVNDNLLTSNLSLSNNKVLVSEVIDYAQNDILTFKIRSNGVSFWSNSALSNAVDFSIKLASPTATLSGNTLSWNSVKNATSYVLVLDDVAYDLESTQTSVNLTNYVDVNSARQVAVKAKNAYLKDSNISSKTVYNRAQKAINNFTNKYFYYGETYDYYLTDSDELFALVEYSFFNFLPTITGYIDYDSSTTISDKISSALDKITATKSFTYQVTKNASRGTGEFSVTMNHKPLSAEPAYTATTTQYSGSMVYVGNGTRNASHVFPSDNYIVSQDVYTTDGLLSAIQHKAKPNFVGNSDIPSQIYQIAKNILIEIVDDTMTDFEKALAIHDYIVNNVSYDTYGLNTVSISQYLGYFHYIESALLYNLGVCDAYSKTFALLCGMEEIPCIIIDGLARSNDPTSGHAWNKIYLDHDGDGTADWFAVDCTYDDAKSGDYEYLYHEYFLIPDSYLSARAEDENTNYPPATKPEGFYSNYIFDGAFSVKIDSNTAAQQFKNYMLTHQNSKVELLVSSDMFSTISMYYRTRFVYSFDNNYYIVYTK